MSITNDYGSYYSYGATAGAGIFGAFIIVYILIMLIALAASVLMIVSEWKIFAKNGKPGWYSLIPFLNNWTLFELVGVQGWWCLVPFANVVFMYIVSYKLAIKYGKSTGFAVITLLFPFVGYPIIAFGKGNNKEQEIKEEKKEESKETETKEKKTTKKTTKKNTKFCAECGAELKNDAVFCPECGKKVK